MKRVQGGARYVKIDPLLSLRAVTQRRNWQLRRLKGARVSFADLSVEMGLAPRLDLLAQFDLLERKIDAAYEAEVVRIVKLRGFAPIRGGKKPALR